VKRRGDKGLEMKTPIRLLRVGLAAVLAFCLWTAAEAKADAVETLMVPSAAMGRDVPVSFQAGGRPAVVLLDSFNADPGVSNWARVGGFDALAGQHDWSSWGPQLVAMSGDLAAHIR
jgi:S-formylglutathione hydrolase FrmB